MLLFKQRQKVEAMSMEEGVALKKKEPAVYLLDVRTLKEYASGHLQGSINLPLQQIRNARRDIADQQAKILVYCQSGSRSRRAALALQEYGFTQVIDLGGIMNWNGKVVR